MLQSYHQNAEQFEIMFNKDKYNALPEKMRAIIANAVEAASQDMSWKAIDRYSQGLHRAADQGQRQVLQDAGRDPEAQLEIYDEVAKKKSAENPLFKEIARHRRSPSPSARRNGSRTRSSAARWHSTTTSGRTAKPRSSDAALEPAKHHSARDRMVLCILESSRYGGTT